MLAIAAHPLGIIPCVLSASETDPAAQVTGAWQKGDPKNAQDLATLMDNSHALTFESEFFDMEPILKAATAFPDLYIFPKPKLMAEIQDRRTQKAFLDRYKIPTATWVKVESAEELAIAAQTLRFPFVLKKVTGGYDGYGTFFIRNAADLKAFIYSSPLIAEKAISFERELAVMIFRSRAGQILVYPLVETRQVNSRCDLVLGPLKHRKLDRILKPLKQALAKSDYVGALGVELFETKDALLVNELAPRVHNSGHYSQQAMSCDQFSLHLMCGTRDKLPKVQLVSKNFVMANLLGQSEQPPQLDAEISGQLHWYGKAESRLGRKLGHINYLGREMKALIRTAIKERTRMFPAAAQTPAHKK